MPTKRKPGRPRNKGRPSDYTPDHCRKIVSYMAKGHSKTAWRAEVGISNATLYRWRDKYPAFREAMDVGEAARARYWERELIDSPNKPTKITPAIFACKASARDEWQDKQAVEIKGEIVTSADDRQALAGALTALAQDHPEIFAALVSERAKPVQVIEHGQPVGDTGHL